MEDKYLKEIEVEAKEILDDTPLEDKLDYFFKLLVNVNIKKLNNKLDLKDTKKSLKENGFEVGLMTQAARYHLKEEENKKLTQAEIIEDYLTKFKNGNENYFEPEDNQLLRNLTIEDELKEAEKELNDKASAYGVDAKAFKTIVKKFIDDLDPNKKQPKVDVVLDGIVQEYDKITTKTKKEIYTQTKN